jgi:anhydro-N-acetylmuramic acid kinase
MKPHLVILGVTTSDSLDAVDTVITKFSPDGGIQDAQHYSSPFPSDLAEQMRSMKDTLCDCNGDISQVEKRIIPPRSLSAIHDYYIKTVAEACLATIVTARTLKTIERGQTPDLVGLHSSPCAHLPPSIARHNNSIPYTAEMGDGQALANILDIPVTYDFCADDIMNGGEGGPFTPIHHLHLALHAKSRGAFPIAFINAGTSGNISVVTNQLGKREPSVLSWDTGPFNYFPDLLAQREAGISHDLNGEIGLLGSVNETLLRMLFERSAVTRDGKNCLSQPPPRSSDPESYREIPELSGTAPVDGKILSLADRMRTAEYFAAYLTMYALSFVPSDCEFPHFYGLCGGGWKNPVSTSHFRFLMRHSPGQIILKEHEGIYHALIARLGKRKPTVESSSAFGFDPNSMEARIFADAAARLVWGEPFSQPSITGVAKPTICGRIRFPTNRDPKEFIVGRYLAEQGTLIERLGARDFLDRRFGRAIPGWKALASL